MSNEYLQVVATIMRLRAQAELARAERRRREEAWAELWRWQPRGYRGRCCEQMQDWQGVEHVCMLAEGHGGTHTDWRATWAHVSELPPLTGDLAERTKANVASASAHHRRYQAYLDESDAL